MTDLLADYFHVQFCKNVLGGSCGPASEALKRGHAWSSRLPAVFCPTMRLKHVADCTRMNLILLLLHSSSFFSTLSTFTHWPCLASLPPLHIELAFQFSLSHYECHIPSKKKPTAHACCSCPTISLCVRAAWPSKIASLGFYFLLMIGHSTPLSVSTLLDKAKICLSANL